MNISDDVMGEKPASAKTILASCSALILHTIYLTTSDLKLKIHSLFSITY